MPCAFGSKYTLGETIESRAMGEVFGGVDGSGRQLATFPPGAGPWLTSPGLTMARANNSGAMPEEPGQ